VALLATVLTSRLSHHGSSLAPGADSGAAMTSFHEAFLVASAITVVGAAAAWFVSDKEAAITMHRKVSETAVEDDSEAALAGVH
jgi:hypothetical protein